MIILGIIAIVVLLIGIGIYNSLIGKKNQVTNAFSAIDVMLKKRYDLIPNLVETIKQYMTYESETLTKITQMRTQGNTGSLTDAEKIQLDQQLNTAVKGVMVNVENYPDLKASANFLSLQEELATTENKVGFSRQFYNENVRALNTAVATIPSSFFAGFAKVSEREFYEVDDPQDRKAPKVTF